MKKVDGVDESGDGVFAKGGQIIRYKSQILKLFKGRHPFATFCVCKRCWLFRCTKVVATKN